MHRRTFVSAAAAAAVRIHHPSVWLRGQSSGGRLAAQPHAPHAVVSPGTLNLDLIAPRDTQLFVPTRYRPARPATLIVGLHGATQGNEVIWRILQAAAEEHGALVLAPNSRGVTWDLIRDGFGADEALLDRALAWTFDHCNVDPGRVVIAGFSDGATAALSLGLINGDLFRRIIAFSPGFIVGHERHGHPSVFISHGTRDQILPIDETSERIVPALRSEGYRVEFRRFDGPHRAPPEMVAAAMAWLEQP
jgi:phospholipase/carboxylesterase